MTACDELRPLLDLAPLGLLDPRERTLHDAHVASCEPCQREARALEAIHATDRASVERELLPMTAPLPEAHVYEKKKVVAPGDAVDPARVEAVGRLISLSCSYCHGRTTREEIVFCASCVAPHHAECFATHGHCALPGCEEKATVRPHVGTQSPRRGGRLLAFALVACTGLGAAAWSALRPDAQSPAEMLARAHAHQRDLLLAIRDDDRAGADAALERLESACAGADDGDPTLADRTRAVRQDARRARRTLDEARISIDASDEDLEKVVDRIGRAAGRNILVSPTVQEKVTLSLRDLRWTEILRTVAVMTRCQIREMPGGILVLEQPPKVTIQFTDANIRTVLQLLAAYSGKNVVIEEDVTGNITLDLKEVPWDEALVTIARARQLYVTQCLGEIVLVSCVPRDGQPLTLKAREWAEDALSVIDDEAQVDVAAKDTKISDVCASIARQTGRQVQARGCGDVRVTLDLRQVPWRGAVEAVAAMARLDLELRDNGEVIFSPTASNLLIVNGARAATWAQLLATVAKVNLVIPEEASGAVVSMRLANTDPLMGLDAMARLLGWTLRHTRPEGKDLYEFVIPERWRPQPAPSAPLPLTLEGTVVTPDGSWAVISDRIYALGDPLLADDGRPMDDSALLDVSEGTARVRVATNDTRTIRMQPPR